MDYGKHCDECGRLDFLPLDCRKCGLVFCGEHRVHKCISSSADYQPPTPPSTAKEIKSSNSVVRSSPPRSVPKSTVTKPSPSSSQNTPAKLASPGNRLGSGEVKSDRAMAALQRLKKLIGSDRTSKQNPPKGPTPEQRRQAIGDVRIPQANRVYLQIERPLSEVPNTLTNSIATRPAKTIWMFFDKSLTAGQILDRAAKQLGVINGILEAQGRKIDVHCLASEFEGTKLDLVPVK